MYYAKLRNEDKVVCTCDAIYLGAFYTRRNKYEYVFQTVESEIIQTYVNPAYKYPTREQTLLDILSAVEI